MNAVPLSAMDLLISAALVGILALLSITQHLNLARMLVISASRAFIQNVR